jgi:ligand-binding sensor domain-containing protein
VSSNAGTSFTETDNSPVIAQYVSDIVVNPRNPDNVFQARAGFTGALPAHNVRVSNDGGLTWSDASNGLPDIPVNALAFDPIFQNQIWAGTDVGMYLSTDGGTTWVPYNQGIPNVAIFDVKANGHTGVVLACTHGRGAFRLRLDAIFIDGFDGN